MATTKKWDRRSIRQQKRNTRTRFRLPREYNWPQWTGGHSHPYFGPLEGVAGVDKVRLVRMVEDPKQAVFIILWESAEALKDFQQSPLCGEFLRSLGLEDSDARQGSPFVSLVYDCGFCLGEKLGEADDLHGRMTLTKLYSAYDASATPDHFAWRNDLGNAFGRWMSPGCEDLAGPPVYQFNAAAYVDGDADGQRQDLPGPPAVVTGHTRGDSSQKIAVCYRFFRWNAHGATAEREEASFALPGSSEMWAARIARSMPPIVAWEQERWDIEVAPGCIDSHPNTEDEEEEEE
ncbi:hypothetical protein B0T22DRAFT_513368 [Podospora appendiculata]|uniref:ABM domain-containing protein n=1 Tax=Podospora appendiculata TaxID=314037 RepID=A0AAE1CD94_9PEZI|nr:hypothetical protein B0T22DRAFT_513368 [Podospora appendiculata]